MGMRELGDKTRRQTDRQLSEREAELLLTTTVDLESLRPKVLGSEAYDQLVAAVAEATASNESLAELQNRIEALGSQAVGLARKLAKALS